MKIVAPPLFKTFVPSAFLPLHLFEETEIKSSYFQYFFVNFFLGLLKVLIRVRLRVMSVASHAHYGKGLPQSVIDVIYSREARDYEWKHHRTTNFRDTWWRRLVAFQIVSLAAEKSLKKVKILDIGTGIGLSIEEMFRIFKDFDLAVEAVGLDYNESMLKEARKIILPRMEMEGLIEQGKREVLFVRGNARDLLGVKNRKESFAYFSENEFDFVTLICGAGGINLPQESFTEQLAVLKGGGDLLMIDIHQPSLHLEEHWPWYFKFFNENLVQYLGWSKVTLPLVLRDVWGWADPTPLFYIVPFAVDKVSLTGFRTKLFDVVTEKWWFGLPVMTTARIILGKEKISDAEAARRVRLQQELLSASISRN